MNEEIKKFNRTYKTFSANSKSNNQSQRNRSQSSRIKIVKNNYDFVKKGMMVGSNGKQMLGIVSTTIKNK